MATIEPQRRNRGVSVCDTVLPFLIHKVNRIEPQRHGGTQRKMKDVDLHSVFLCDSVVPFFEGLCDEDE